MRLSTHRLSGMQSWKYACMPNVRREYLGGAVRGKHLPAPRAWVRMGGDYTWPTLLRTMTRLRPGSRENMLLMCAMLFAKEMGGKNRWT
jgi:hypothetical protein